MLVEVSVVAEFKKAQELRTAFIERYRCLVEAKHPNRSGSWPLVSGYSVILASYQGWTILVYKETDTYNIYTPKKVGELNQTVVGVEELSEVNVGAARGELEEHFKCGPTDAVVLIPPPGDFENELEYLLQRHEMAMGCIANKIFLGSQGN